MRTVNLVGHQQDGDVGLTKHADHCFVVVGRSDVCVNDEQHGIALSDANLDLFGNEFPEALGVAFPATGVEQDEVAARPVGRVGDAVTRHTRDVFDNRFAPTDDAVDQRRLADVRSSDDRDGRRRRTDDEFFEVFLINACPLRRQLSGDARDAVFIEVVKVIDDAGGQFGPVPLFDFDPRSAVSEIVLVILVSHCNSGCN